MWPGLVADMYMDLNAGAKGPLGSVAQCRRLVVYRDGIHRGAAGRWKSRAGGWAVGTGRFEQGALGRSTRAGWAGVCSGDRTTHS